MEQLEKVEVLLLVEGCDRDNVVRAERGIALLDDLLQIGFGDLVARNVEGEDLKGEILEGQVSPSCLPVGGQRRDLFGDKEAAIIGKALKNDIFEGELAGFSA